ncbi:hypothetical protein WA158_003577 [Blastocystis sp. Blastoise]
MSVEAMNNIGMKYDQCKEQLETQILRNRELEDLVLKYKLANNVLNSKECSVEDNASSDISNDHNKENCINNKRDSISVNSLSDSINSLSDSINNNNSNKEENNKKAISIPIIHSEKQDSSDEMIDSSNNSNNREIDRIDINDEKEDHENEPNISKLECSNTIVCSDTSTSSNNSSFIDIDEDLCVQSNGMISDHDNHQVNDNNKKYTVQEEKRNSIENQEDANYSQIVSRNYITDQEETSDDSFEESMCLSTKEAMNES